MMNLLFFGIGLFLGVFLGLLLSSLLRKLTDPGGPDEYDAEELREDPAKSLVMQ